MKRHDLGSCLIVLTLDLFLVLSLVNGEGTATDEQRVGLSQFFGSIDRDGDGQIEPAEALSYIGANFDERDINESQIQAAERIYQNLEGTDADATISKAEVEKHLKRLLKVLVA